MGVMGAHHAKKQPSFSKDRFYQAVSLLTVPSTQAKAEFLAETLTLVVIYASGKALHNSTFVLRNITENDGGGGTKKLGDSFTCSLFKATFMGCLPNRSGFWLVESFARWPKTALIVFCRPHQMTLTIEIVLI